MPPWTNARHLVASLGGCWKGSYGMVRCPCHSDHDPSLMISDNEAGDGVVVHCFTDCDWRDVKDALRRGGLLPAWDGQPAPQPDPREVARRRAEREKDEQRKAEAAQTLWCAAVDLTPADPAGRYLISRGLPGPWPPSLKFLEATRHPTGATTPALIVAACKWPDRQPVAVQLTALTSEGRKAKLQPVRWTRGVLRGAAVRLAPWSDGKTLVLVEGTEDGLAILQAMPDAVPWATLGTSGVASVVLPKGAGVTVTLDGDEPGRRAAREAAAVFKLRGHRVRITHLPDGVDPASMLAAKNRRAA